MNESGIKKVLLIEDNIVTSRTESAMLIRNGYHVVTVPDGETAVEIALTDLSIDLILMDIDLGSGIDGPTAAGLIVKKRDIPIVFLTSHSERETVNKVKSITRYGYVVKNSGNFVLLSSIEMAFELFEAHKKTKESETNFRQLAENINEAFWLSDEKMDKILYLSPACREIWNIGPDQWNGNHRIFLDNIHPEDRPDVILSRKLLVEKGEIFSGEFRIICYNGEIKWIRGRAYPVYNHSGDLVRYAGVAEDITYQKSAETALLKSEAKFRSYVENAPIGIFIADNEGNFIEVNPAAAKGLGYNEDELLMLTVNDIVDISNIAVALNHFKVVAKDGSAIRDLLFKKKDGSLLWAQVNAVKLTDERFMAFCHDITPRKKAEILLYKSEERMRSIFDVLPIGIFQSTMKGRFVYINSGISGILGYDSTQDLIETVNRSSVEKVLYADIGNRNHFIDEIRSDPGKWKIFENSFKRKDGTVFDALLAYCERPDPVTGEAFIYGYVIDVTEKKIAEEKIKNLLYEKELLLKEVHHRIKNNMSAVAALLYLQSESIQDTAAVSALDDARNRILSMMLIYDKLYRTADYKNVDLNGYISDLVDEISLSFRVEGRNILLEKDIENFEMDSQVIFPIGIMINEVITNSFKHAFTGRKSGKIFLSIQKHEELLKLIIRDNGIGVPDTFDINNADGFGLSLVNILVQQMNGSLEIVKCDGTEYRIMIEV